MEESPDLLSCLKISKEHKGDAIDETMLFKKLDPRQQSVVSAQGWSGFQDSPIYVPGRLQAGETDWRAGGQVETGIPRVEKVERRSEETTASEFHQTRCPKRWEERDGQRGAWGLTGVPQVLIRERHWGKDFLEGLEEPRLTLREGQRAWASLAGPDSLTNLGAGPGGLAALRRGLSNPRPRATILWTNRKAKRQGQTVPKCLFCSSEENSRTGDTQAPGAQQDDVQHPVKKGKCTQVRSKNMTHGNKNQSITRQFQKEQN